VKILCAIPKRHHAIKDSPTQTISFYPLIDCGDIFGEPAPAEIGAGVQALRANNNLLFKWAGADISP
jgi:hypothetical protein